MPAKKTNLLVVTPTKRELGGVQQEIRLARDTQVVGIGHQAGPALSRLLDKCQPNAVLSLGFGGGLTQSARTGDVVVCTVVYRLGAVPLTLAIDPLSTALEASGVSHELNSLLTVDKPLLLGQDKQRAGARSGAMVVDMEGYELARCAQKHQVPFYAVRVVLDELNQSLPDFVGRIITAGGHHELRYSLQALIAHPALLRQMFRLGSQARLAIQSMDRVTKAIFPSMEGTPELAR